MQLIVQHLQRELTVPMYVLCCDILSKVKGEG